MSSVALLLSFMFSSVAASAPAGLSDVKPSVNSSDGFLYFAYGSNLLKERLRLRNPSAVFVSVGCLKDYSLRFGYWTENASSTGAWHGGVATIEEERGREVWGVIWKLDVEHLSTLDNQEGVKKGNYRPVGVTVSTEEGDTCCRSYQMNNFKPYLTSPPYKQVVCLGAKQHGLPPDYIQKLEAVETNGYSGPSVLDTIQGVQASDA